LGDANISLGNAWRVAANWSQDKPDGSVVDLDLINISGKDKK
jgi:hypothetical protein